MRAPDTIERVPFDSLPSPRLGGVLTPIKRGSVLIDRQTGTILVAIHGVKDDGHVCMRLFAGPYVSRENIGVVVPFEAGYITQFMRPMRDRVN